MLPVFPTRFLGLTGHTRRNANSGQCHSGWEVMETKLAVARWLLVGLGAGRCTLLVGGTRRDL